MKTIHSKLKFIVAAALVFTATAINAQRPGGQGGGSRSDRQSFNRPQRNSTSADRSNYQRQPAAQTPRAADDYRNLPAYRSTAPAASSRNYSGSGYRPNSSSSYRPNSSYRPYNNYRPNVTVNNYRGGNYYYRNPRPSYGYYYGGAYHNRPAYYRSYSRPSFGIRLSILPSGYYPFYLNSNRYFYHGGSYYRYSNNYYETIAPPFGAVVPLLPGGAVLVPIGGRSYYEYGGTYYEPRFDAYGNRTYAIAGTDGILQSDRIADAGSNDIISDASIQSNMEKEGVITELPSAFKTVELDDKIYYVSPAGDYYVKLVDENGKAMYQLTTKAEKQ